MSLKFKRNLPLILWLMTIIFGLVFVIGHYPIIAYSFN